MDKLYTVKEVATILQQGTEFVRVKIREGKLRAHKIGKEWRIWETDLEAYINDNSNV